jgi:hypothetical protein
MSRRRLFELVLVRWGFAFLVAIAIAIGLVAALTVAPPMDVPSVALQAAVIYRVEVGAAVFLGLYLATLAFALALQNRGFTEIGSGAVRAQDLASVSSDLIDAKVAAELLEDAIEQMDAFKRETGDSHVGRKTV